MKREGNNSSSPALPRLQKHMEWPLFAPQKVGKSVVSNLINGDVRGQHLWILLGHALVKDGGEKIQDFLFLRKKHVSGTIYSRFLPPLKLIHAVASQEFRITNDTP